MVLEKTRMLLRYDNRIGEEERLKLLREFLDTVKQSVVSVDPFSVDIITLRRAEIIKTIALLCQPIVVGSFGSDQLSKPILFVIIGKPGGGKSLIADVIYDTLSGRVNPYLNLSLNEDGSKKNKMSLEDHPTQAAFQTVSGALIDARNLYFNASGNPGLVEVFQNFPDINRTDVFIISEDTRYQTHERIHDFFNVIEINMAESSFSTSSTLDATKKSGVTISIKVVGEELKTTDVTNMMAHLNEVRQNRIAHATRVLSRTTPS